MAIVDQIQDKNGAVRDIVDKSLNEKTAQTGVASSDYVLLEDTDGAYHKIAKASFTEAVRGALGSVINSVAKGTDIAKVPVLDSNNDLGMGTLSNLASVLGACVVNYQVSGSLNNFQMSAGYYLDSCTEKPVENSNGVIISLGDNLHCIQIASAETDNFGKLYFRVNWNGWNNWNQL